MSGLLGRLRRRRADRLADWLPWLLTLDERRCTILTTPGGFLRVARLELPDLETASPEALVVHHARLGEAFARLGTGWSVWLDQWRTYAPGYLPESDFDGCEAARLVDASRRAQFAEAGRPVFSNTAFIAVQYVPRSRDAVLAFLLERDDPLVAANAAFFEEETSTLLETLSHTMRGVTLLAGDELASYLEASVSYRPRRVSMPAGVLAPQLAGVDWRTSPGLSIDGRHVVAVELRNFGTPTPMTCEGLHEPPFECRWVTAFHGLDPDGRRKELSEVRKRWAVKQHGMGSLLAQIVTKNPYAGRADPEAERALASLDVMQGELAERPYALAHSEVYVWDEDRRKAEERAAQVASYLNAQGLTARVATLNAVMAPLAAMPGNTTEETANVRRLRIEVAAITRVAPVTGVSQGTPTDWRFGGPALLVGGTRRSVPYYFALHSPGSDVGHCGLVGRTGSGKSALLSFMAMQMRRYPGARVAVLDRGRSFMVACLAMGGDWIELGTGRHGVQPLRHVDRPEELAWAQGWVLRALRLRGLETTPAMEAAVGEGLRHVAAEPDPDARTLTALHGVVGGSDAVRQTLAYYARSGPYGGLFDSAVAGYGGSAVLGVETREIVQLEDAAPLAVSAMFRAIRRDRLTGDAPKLVVVDEAWSLMGHPLFAGELESWAREMRKQKAVLVLATQSLEDLRHGSARVVFDQLDNRFFLPHAEALRPQTAELYRDAGLEREQVEALARARPKAEYLLQTPVATRLVEIRLAGDALRLCGASSPADLARAESLLRAGVAPGADFTRAWLAETTGDWLRARDVATLPGAA